jgi:hypothetical protein
LSRLIRLTQSYARGARRLGAHEPGPMRQKLARAVALLAASDMLAGADDLRTMLPPAAPQGLSLMVYGARVAGTSLRLWYTATDEELVLRALTRA